MANNKGRSKNPRNAEPRNNGRNAPAGETNRAEAHLQPDATKPFVVKGQIRDKDGSSAASLLVKGFDKDLDGEEPLGETTTDERGASGPGVKAHDEALLTKVA